MFGNFLPLKGAHSAAVKTKAERWKKIIGPNRSKTEKREIEQSRKMYGIRPNFTSMETENTEFRVEERRMECSQNSHLWEKWARQKGGLALIAFDIIKFCFISAKDFAKVRGVFHALKDC